MRPLFVAMSLILAAPSAAGADQPSAQSPLPAKSRAETIDFLATKLVDTFVFPDVGVRYAETLRRNQQAGKYDALADDEAFAKQVTDDLLAVAFDGHLRVRPKSSIPTQAPPPGAAARRDGVGAAARLTKDIAYLRFEHFMGEEKDVAAADKFMRDNADADTIIFDLRTNGGGGLAEMDAVFPYLFAKETVLVQMDTRRSVDDGDANPLDEGPTMRRVSSPDSVVRRQHVVIPSTTEKRLQDAKVFVLVSPRTASAAEHFTLSMKRTGRATIIGETTAGAGHYGDVVELPGDFAVFVAVGRTFDPDTDKGWDAVGIAPQVEVPAERALVEALVRSGVAPAEAERLSAQYAPDPERMKPIRPRAGRGPGI